MYDDPSQRICVPFLICPHQCVYLRQASFGLMFQRMSCSGASTCISRFDATVFLYRSSTLLLMCLAWRYFSYEAGVISLTFLPATPLRLYQWNEEFCFRWDNDSNVDENNGPPYILLLRVYDHMRLTRDELLGQVRRWQYSVQAKTTEGPLTSSAFTTLATAKSYLTPVAHRDLFFSRSR